MKYKKLRIKESMMKELIQEKIKNSLDLAVFKRKISKKYKTSYPSNMQLLKVYHELVKKKRIKKSENIEESLKTKPIRSLSGIVNVSVLTKPYPCPGKCIYCPTEKGIPKSYVSGEPAVERAKTLKYDPYLQVSKRIEMLKATGHPTDKIDLRIVGGTWSYYPKKYQTWFIKKCFDGCNEKTSKSLLEAQKSNETTKHRIIGLSIETRPDFIDKDEIRRLRKLGVTKVELGIQSIYDDVLKLNKRGHKIKQTIKATQLLKDAGFKASYQIMPNLPGANPKKDIEMFEELFSNPNFKPDLIKIYPCALLKKTALYKLYLKGNYKPYSEKTLIDVIVKAKKKIPYYVRVERVLRDIPSYRIIKGATKISNLREVVQSEIKKQGWQCKCIRCREIKARYSSKEKIYLFKETYDASGGKEIFLSFENKKRDKLYSLLRLRIISKSKPVFSVLKNAALIREIHTYGQLVPISKKGTSAQHKGLGKKLIKQAEDIVKKEFEIQKIAVISGIGARDYWKKFNYKLKGTYMVKSLK